MKWSGSVSKCNVTAVPQGGVISSPRQMYPSVNVRKQKRAKRNERKGLFNFKIARKIICSGVDYPNAVNYGSRFALCSLRVSY